MRLTDAERDDVKEEMMSRGYTVRRWAEERGFAYQTVRNILYREQGLKHQRGPVARYIVASLRREFL